MDNMIKHVNLFGNPIENLKHLSISESDRIYYFQKDHFFSFICLSRISYDPAANDKWENCSVTSYFHGSFNTVDILSHIGLTDGDQLIINNNTRNDVQEFADSSKMLIFLNAIMKIESYFNDGFNGFEKLQKELKK